YDQGELGSCTANAIGGAFQFEQKKQNIADFTPSRLFIYYQERYLEGTVNSDSGAMIRDGMKVVAHDGAPPETLWPYDIAKFAQMPSPTVYASGTNNQVMIYGHGLCDPTQMKACQAAGDPVEYG